jgi:hypothetical protein
MEPDALSQTPKLPGNGRAACDERFGTFSLKDIGIAKNGKRKRL